MATRSSRSLATQLLFVLSTASIAAASSSTCPKDTPLSCTNSTIVQDLCCFNAPGGQLLQTQFWDTDPVSGPVDSWTIHGLWPDHCDGSFDANCDDARAYTNITQILTSFNKTDLLAYMHTYWPDYQGNDESFWEHEWGKHGTCISTLNPSCYSGYIPTQEVPDFFQRTVDLFKTLPSYQWLADAGIVPSSSATYTSSQIEAALAAHHDGLNVTIGCSNGALDEIWYGFHVRGSVQSGEFVATGPDGSKSTCPETGVKYLPKIRSNATTTAATTTLATQTTATAKSTASPFSGKGHLNVIVAETGNQTGCVISGGAWYTTGTCATYTAVAVAGAKKKVFTLQSSKGYCAVVDTAFACNAYNTAANATTFTRDGQDLKSDVGIKWSADQTPTGSLQAKVYSNNKHEVQIRIKWQGI